MESKTMMHRTLVLVLAVWLMACAATVVGTPSNVHSSLITLHTRPGVTLDFLLIRPQQKRQKDTDDMLKVLRKGDKVRTTGGIRGEIYELTENDVTLQIDAKVKINVLRSNIASKIGKPSSDTGDTAKT